MILSNRKDVYAAAKLNHPERWSRDTRDWSIEDKVWLNPEKEEATELSQNISS